jgi:hypothetical protein
MPEKTSFNNNEKGLQHGRNPFKKQWWAMLGLNQRPLPCESEKTKIT